MEGLRREEKLGDSMFESVEVYGCDWCKGEWFVDEVRKGIVLLDVVEDGDTGIPISPQQRVVIRITYEFR